MDNTSRDIINLYGQITNLGLGCYISQYHVSLILKWDEMYIRQDWNNDDYKKIRNILYSLFILLVDSINSRNNFIDFCLETIKTHNDNTISVQHDNLRNLFDNFNNINNMNGNDYGYVIELLMSLYNGSIQHQDRGAIDRHIALTLRKYDMSNKYIATVVNPSSKQDIDIDDVVLSIYGK